MLVVEAVVVCYIDVLACDFWVSVVDATTYPPTLWSGPAPLLLGSCLARVMPCERPLGWPWASRNHCNNTVTNFLPPDADSNDHTPLGLAPSLSVTTGANS